MTVPGGSAVSGDPVATASLPGVGAEVQAVVQVDASGHMSGTLPTYLYATPSVAVGASKLYLDLFNAVGSGKVIDVRGIWIIPDVDVALTGAVAVRVDAYRTSAVGTGGTAAQYRSPTPDVGGGNITPLDTQNATLPAQVTARWLPSGGATIDDWLFPTYSLGEEAATSQAYMTQYQNILPELTIGQRLSLREGEGLLLKQGPVASAGNTHFLIAFTLE